MTTANGMRQTALTCHGHTRPVVHLAFSGITENGYLLISACKGMPADCAACSSTSHVSCFSDGKPMLRQGETGDWIGTFEGHKGAVWGCALSRDGKKAATGAADFCAKIWDTETGDEVSSLSHSHIVRSVDFSSDNGFLLTGSNEKLVKIYDLNAPDGGPVIVGKGHTQAVRHALFAHNDNWIISTSDDRTVRFWERNTGEEINRIELPSIPTSIEISAGGEILSVSCGRTVSFWNVQRMDKIKEYPTAAQVLSSTLHPDMTVYVCGGDDFKMYKYDYADGTEKGNFFLPSCSMIHDT